MKKAVFATALLIGVPALAQVGGPAEPTAYEGDGAVTTIFETEGAAGGAYIHNLADAGTAVVLASTGAAVEPSNADPERDARGIAVISAAAVAPAGWNGTSAGEAMGGPELDAATGESPAAGSYPACTASVTDKCLQTYEKGRRD